MKQIKTIISLLVFCSIIFAITARNLPSIPTHESYTHISPPGPADPKAKAVMDSIYERYDELKSLKVNMVYTTGYQDRYATDTIHGFRDGNKYRLEMPHQDVVHDGKKVWFYNKSSKEVYSKLDNPTELNFIYPTKALKSWESSFNYSIAGELDMGEQSFVRVLFVPKDSDITNEGSPEINLFIDKNNFQILKITFSQPDGYIHILDYQDFIPNIKFHPSLFEFDFS